MSARESLARVLQALPDERLREVLDFAESLRDREAATGQPFGRAQLARAYGSDEPDYTEADFKPEPTS